MNKNSLFIVVLLVQSVYTASLLGRLPNKKFDKQEQLDQEVAITINRDLAPYKNILKALFLRDEHELGDIKTQLQEVQESGLKFLESLDGLAKKCAQEVCSCQMSDGECAIINDFADEGRTLINLCQTNIPKILDESLSNHERNQLILDIDNQWKSLKTQIMYFMRAAQDGMKLKRDFVKKFFLKTMNNTAYVALRFINNFFAAFEKDTK